MSQFSFPSPAGVNVVPQWTGAGFRLGDTVVPLLEYSENFEGWSDDLTALHEEAAGDSHPIDLASRDNAIAQLAARFKQSESPIFLEIGCSSGFMLKAMLRQFPSAMIIGADVVRNPLLALAREIPTIPLLRFDLLQCPLASESCDAVVMLNVLEHIRDDVGALAQAYRILRPGGVAVIEVPAGPHLFDVYDKALKHFRRYSMRELTEKLRNVGFTIERQSHLGFFLYPAFAAVKRRNQRTADAFADPNAVVMAQASESSSSRLLSIAVSMEKILGRWISYPTGIRCLVVGRKV